MSEDTIRVRVIGPQFRYDREQFTEGDELDVVERTLESHPRTIERVDDSEDEADAEEDDPLDAEAFVNRTPMDDVIADIEAGDADDILAAVEAVAEREGVKDAIAARRDELAVPEEQEE